MRLSIVPVVVVLPLWASLARAQQQPAPVGGSLSLQSQPPATIAYPALNSQPFGTQHLGGEWGGARPWLEDHGIYIGVNYYPEIAAIVAGSQRQGIDYTSQFGLSFGQRSRASLLVDFAGDEMTFLVKMVVDPSVN
jgi:hypothetical protein